jgi:hypothetical protein
MMPCRAPRQLLESAAARVEWMYLAWLLLNGLPWGEHAAGSRWSLQKRRDQYLFMRCACFPVCLALKLCTCMYSTEGGGCVVYLPDAAAIVCCLFHLVQQSLSCKLLPLLHRRSCSLHAHRVPPASHIHSPDAVAAYSCPPENIPIILT